jgi:integrase
MGTPLSVKAIESMRPGDKPKTDVGEAQGLRVTCAASGAKTFIYRYRSPETGKLVQMKLGRFPELKLAEARLKVVQLKERQREGVCPKAELARQQEAQKQVEQEVERERQSRSFTVTDLVEVYLAEVIEDRMVTDPQSGKRKRVAGVRKPKGQAEVRRTLYNDAVRVLGEIPAVEVGRQEVVRLIKEILDRGARVQAGAVLRELTAAYEYALAMGKLPDDFPNPALLAKSSLKSARMKLSPERGRRALSDEELRAVLAWLPGSGFSPTQKHVLMLALWTGCRTGEICEAEWADIDLDAGIWHLKETKNQSSRNVQLPRQAVEYLRPLKWTSATYVFPSMRTGKPIKQKSLSETKWFLKNPEKVPRGASLKPEQRWLDSIPDWSPHDLRRTVRTGLARLGCPNEVAEAILGHSRKGIEGTYDLHHYEEECRRWLQKWADHLDGLCEGT